jgi:choline dehydrogenase-like flavoprotein
MRVAFLIEQTWRPGNRVSIDPAHVDAMGLPRPVIHWSLDDYVLDGMAQATRVARSLFRRAGITDRTDPGESLLRRVSWKGGTYAWAGAGHFAGTHVMGDDPATSVVDSRQRLWSHDNLYVAGAGSMPTMGTSNPTLTVGALAVRTADAVIAETHA